MILPPTPKVHADSSGSRSGSGWVLVHLADQRFGHCRVVGFSRWILSSVMPNIAITNLLGASASAGNT